MSYKYVINRSAGNVSLKDGLILIPVGGYKQVAEVDLDHEDIGSAVRRGWIEVLDNHPSEDQLADTPQPPKVEIAKSPLEGSLTPPGKEPAPEAEQPAEETAKPATRSKKA